MRAQNRLSHGIGAWLGYSQHTYGVHPDRAAQDIASTHMEFIQTVLPKMGITATVIDPADLGALERACGPQNTLSPCFEA